MSATPIKIEGLTKYYEGRLILDEIDLAIQPGTIYGLLGRNGIGKTTLIRILLGLEPPTRGRTYLLGAASDRLRAADRGRIGYVAEGHNLIQYYKVGQIAELCRGLALQWDQQFFDELIKAFRLPLDRNTRTPVFEASHEPALLGGVTVLRGPGVAISGKETRLYQPLHERPEAELRAVDLTLIPYYSWANRDPATMTVWVPCTWKD